MQTHPPIEHETISEEREDHVFVVHRQFANFV